MVSRRAVITGDVQGVFFRDTARREAEAKGVAGWIANRPDGAVEALFEGEPDAVESMLAFCRQGPPRARVDSVEVSDSEPQGLDGFEVR